MGWGSCGRDDRGRPIGYLHGGTCDEPGCKKRIDRGLGFACGGMHGTQGGYTCGRYYCGDHLEMPNLTDAAYEELRQRVQHPNQMCRRCRRDAEVALQPRDKRGRFKEVA